MKAPAMLAHENANQINELLLTPLAERCVQSVLASTLAADGEKLPYPHFYVADVLPEDVVDQLLALPFIAQDVHGQSGLRDMHNDTRTYIDAANRAQYEVCEAVAQCFQDQRVVDTIAKVFSAPIDGCNLRLEMALDQDGYWNMPHTDLGVKALTYLLYLSRDPAHADLATDVYDQQQQWHSRRPSLPNTAMVFVPGDDTFHGFEKRPFSGVRKTLILNYVTPEWRAREQLAFPEMPVHTIAFAKPKAA
ncbi:MAG TPA: 2OG-Fe(II) oxygenase [Alphaproteobacteria bacterium]|nr:2OG-Fe(II) oxygenase [Alphaproteobacteria bacterium]